MKKENNVKKAAANKEKRCLCPYCEELVIASCPFCEACGAVLSYCVSCQIMVPDKEATKCPECGALLRRGRKEK
ncbi:MAG: hypothetical protein H8E40_14890 [Chloroflexi bacterium]|nr:hypothetical protein [Chloroflexota bacterium]MBL7062049.1 hypothetical protein [Dehalococcoidia bacterium]